MTVRAIAPKGISRSVGVRGHLPAVYGRFLLVERCGSSGVHILARRSIAWKQRKVRCSIAAQESFVSGKAFRFSNSP